MARALNPDLKVKRGELLRVPVSDLIADPAKRGRAFPPSAERVAEVAASIRELGQIQPVPVSVTPERMLELIAGWTRYEALLKLQEETGNERFIDCVVKDGNEEEFFLANIAENKERNITTEIDDAHNVRRLERDFAKTDEEILLIYSNKIDPKTGDKIPRYPQWLENMRKLVKLPKAEQKEIHEGRLKASVGYVLADLPEEAHEEILQEVRAESESKGEVVTAPKVAKKAKEKGISLPAKKKRKSGPENLSSVQIRAAWTYMRDNFEEKPVKKFADAVLKFYSGETPEPDFFRTVRRLLKED